MANYVGIDADEVSREEQDVAFFNERAHRIPFYFNGYYSGRRKVVGSGDMVEAIPFGICIDQLDCVAASNATGDRHGAIWGH